MTDEEKVSGARLETLDARLRILTKIVARLVEAGIGERGADHLFFCEKDFGKLNEIIKEENKNYVMDKYGTTDAFDIAAQSMGMKVFDEEEGNGEEEKPAEEDPED